MVLSVDNSIEDLVRRVIAFQESRFPKQTVDGKLAHLQREIKELRDEPSDHSEWADCLILLLGAAFKHGFDLDGLIVNAHAKMDINEDRQWGEPDAEGVCHHIDPAESAAAVAPSERRARLVTTHEGKFINLDDIRAALNDEAFVLECAHVLVVCRDRNDSWPKCLQYLIGSAIMVLAGDEARCAAAAKKD